jgi:ribosomal protein L20
MVRVKRGNVARKRRKKILSLASGYEERILYYLE